MSSLADSRSTSLPSPPGPETLLDEQRQAQEAIFERLTDEEVLPKASPRLMALALRHFIWEEAEKVAAMHSFVQPIADIAPETTLAAELYVLRLKLIAKAYRYLMGIEP